VELAIDEGAPAVACIGCGYDLRGLDPAGRCPECGLRLHWTFRAPRQLSEYNANWVTRMSRATRVLAITYGGLFIFLVLGLTGVLPQIDPMPSVAFLLASILQLIGMWMLAAHSGHPIEPRSPAVRWMSRTTPIGMVIASVASLMVIYHYHPILEPIFAISMIIGALAPTMIFIRLRTVARLIADVGLAEYSTIVGVGFLCTVVAMAGLILIATAVPHLGESVAGMVVMIAVVVLLLLFLLWGAFILLSCMVDFGRAARIAQAQWKAEQSPV
jgi:hypothetical protein